MSESRPLPGERRSRERTSEEDLRAAASRLLARPAPERYLEAWRRSLRRRVIDEVRPGRVPLTVFRLGEEQFALATGFVREVHAVRRVHRVPGRTNEVFRGLVSLRGELHLCMDLHRLLGVATPRGATDRAGARMVVLEREGAAWVFEADEVLEVRRFEEEDVKPSQPTVARAAVHFTDALVDRGEGRMAARLDPPRLFAGLAGKLR